MLHKLIHRVRPAKSSEDSDTGTEGYPVVDPYFWKPKVGLNFGDYLASAIVQRMLAAKELLVNEPVSRHRRLFSVGSVLHFAHTGDAIWGTGRNGKIAVDRHHFERLDIRAVRGPLTRRFLGELGHSAPAIYGDPALLIPKLFPNRFRRRSGKQAVGIVPNLHDVELIRGDNIIDPTWRWDAVISAICACDFIVSSSLHGLVIADAFGIPCAHLRLSDTEPDFKYIDYCEGAGRSQFWSSTSVAEALDRGPLPPIAHDAEALMDAFPYDLWDA